MAFLIGSWRRKPGDKLYRMMVKRRYNGAPFQNSFHAEFEVFAFSKRLAERRVMLWLMRRGTEDKRISSKRVF